MRTDDKIITADSTYSMHIYIRDPGARVRAGAVEGALNIMIDEQDQNIEIMGSHTIHSKRDKKAILAGIIESELYNHALFTRSPKSYQVEWSVHNLAYNMFQRSNNRIRRSAADVDLNNGKTPIFKLIYYIITLNGLLDW